MKKFLLSLLFLCFILIVASQTTNVVFDIDGNLYETIKIGDQEWLSSNLRVTRFNNGIPIHTEKDSLLWIDLKTPAYCWYKNDPLTYKSIYGALYNQYAAASENLCMKGWKVPSDIDFRNMAKFLDPSTTNPTVMSETVGGMLKEASNTHWEPYENIEASNISGFTARPAGCRGWSGWYNAASYFAYFWTSNSLFLSIRWASNRVFMGSGASKYVGSSIRCIKDYDYVYTDEDLDYNNILIYPNPAQDFLNIIIIKNPLSYIQIFDNNGKIIYEEKITSEFNKIDVKSFSKGVYYLIIYDNMFKNVIKVEKIIII